MNKQTILIGSIKATPLGEVWVAPLFPRLVAVEFGVPQASFECTVHKQIKCDLEYAPRQVDGSFIRSRNTCWANAGNLNGD